MSFENLPYKRLQEAILLRYNNEYAKDSSDKILVHFQKNVPQHWNKEV